MFLVGALNVRSAETDSYKTINLQEVKKRIVARDSSLLKDNTMDSLLSMFFRRAANRDSLDYFRFFLRKKGGNWPLADSIETVKKKYDSIHDIVFSEFLYNTFSETIKMRLLCADPGFGEAGMRYLSDLSDTALPFMTECLMVEERDHAKRDLIVGEINERLEGAAEEEVRVVVDNYMKIMFDLTEAEPVRFSVLQGLCGIRERYDLEQRLDSLSQTYTRIFSQKEMSPGEKFIIEKLRKCTR